MGNDSLNYGRHLIYRWLKEYTIHAALDLGAGHGNDLKTVRKISSSATLHAIESNVHYVHAIREIGVEPFNIDLETNNIPLANESVDLVIANQILEHTKQIFWIIHEATRVLKVNGLLLIGVPNLASLHNRLLLLLGKQPTCINNSTAHVRGFTRGDLLNFFNKCWPHGYAVEKFGGSNFYPLPAKAGKIASKIFPTGSVSIFYLLRKTREYDSSFIKYPEDWETNFFLGTGHEHHAIGTASLDQK